VASSKPKREALLTCAAAPRIAVTVSVNERRARSGASRVPGPADLCQRGWGPGGWNYDGGIAGEKQPLGRKEPCNDYRGG